MNFFGWKGKDDIIIKEDKEFYVITEHRKNKETGDVYTNEHQILKIDVDCMLMIIKNNCSINEEYGYKFLVRKVIEHYNIHEHEFVPIDIMINAFNGGKYRAKYYFKLFYYPLKVLEYQGKIDYFGRVGIRLR